VTDYAANALALGTGMQVAGPGDQGPWSDGNPTNWRRTRQRIEAITDGSSNTVMVGTKALATDAYSNRGSVSLKDAPIADAGIFNGDGMGLLRAMGPDNLAWMATPASDAVQPNYDNYLPGASFKHSNATWLKTTFEVVRDAPSSTPNYDTYNRWGSPYSAGALFGMADGSIRTIRHGTNYQVMIPVCTPNGGEVLTLE
jgi:hypothetical protein